MKQTKILLAALCGTALLFSSCEKDDPKPSEGQEQDQPTITKDDPGFTNTGTYNTQPVETQKQDVEDAGIQLITEIDDLQESKSMKAMESMASLGSEESTSIAVAFTQIASKPTSLKSSAESIVDEFNAEKGIYTWNPSINDWDEAPSTEGIFFKFPSTEGSTVNDAELAVTEFDAKYISAIEEEMPTAIKAYLKVGSEEVMSYNMSGKYNSDGMPEDVSTSLTIDSEFKIEASIQTSDTRLSEEFSFTRNGANLVSFGAFAKGQFTEAKINQIESEMDKAEDGELPNFSVLGEFLSSFEFYYQIVDVKLNTNINTKAIANEDIESMIDDEDAILNSLNKNIDISLAYANGEVIAKTEFILEEFVDDFGYTSTEPNVIFIFSDGSRVAAETYFEESMSEFETELEAFIEEIEETYDLAEEDDYYYDDNYYYY